MRTRIYLEREPSRGPGRLAGWNVDGPYMDVSHDGELAPDMIAAYRALGEAVGKSTGKSSDEQLADDDVDAD